VPIQVDMPNKYSWDQDMARGTAHSLAKER